MGTLCPELAKEGHLSLSPYKKAPAHSSKWLTTSRRQLPLSRRYLPLLLITLKQNPSLNKSRPQRTEQTELTRRPRSRRSSLLTEQLRRRRQPPRKPPRKPPKSLLRSQLRRPQRGKLTLLARMKQLR